MSIASMGAAAKQAAHLLAKASSDQKNGALQSVIKTLKAQHEAIMEANREDIVAAQAAGLDKAMIDRLSLKNRLEAILDDIEHVIHLPDPIGESFEQHTIGELNVQKQRTPLGVLGVIYESRPNVTIDISALTIKSGNCAILRGGSETLRTNRVLVEGIQEALETVHLPARAIQLIASADRNDVHKMLRMHESIDLIIPRGGAALHRYCRENSTIPVITGGIGVCHLFVDESADLERSLPVIVNAKTQRPTVCNALDTLLVHAAIADVFIPQVIDKLSEKGVTFRLDVKGLHIAQKHAKVAPCSLAQACDWDTEWLSLVLGIKVVEDLEEAIAHIQTHSTGHSDGILTQDKKHAEAFVSAVDSAAVYVNASTRFTDGGQLGLGAEVAISTQKLHARGPMGLRELTSYKWVINGNYSIRQ